MSTKISWADDTWNPVIGCSKVSAGCLNCYAEKMACRLAYMRKPPYREVVYGILSRKDDPGEVICYDHWFGNTVFVESALTKPLHWRNPRKIFVVSMGDLFHESVPFEWIDRVFEIVMQCPQHQFLCLTKRAGRMRKYFEGVKESQARCGEPTPFPLPNVHLGVTVENQDNVGRVADLIQTPAAKRFVSFEPLLGRLDIKQLRGDEFYCPQCRKFFDTEKFWMCPHCGEQIVGEDGDGCETTCPACKNTFGSDEEVPVCPNCNNSGGGRYIQPDYSSCFSGDLENAIMENIDYAFIGCESGPGARLCTLDDIRYVMDQCHEAGVKVHVKQIPLNEKCNKNINEWPQAFRIREV